MTLFNELSGPQLAILASVIASVIAEGMSIDEQNIFANFLITLGDALATIAASNEVKGKSTNSY